MNNWNLIIIIAIAALFNISCNESIIEKDILGSWTIDQDEVKYPKSNLIDTMTFFDNGTYTIKVYVDGKLNESFSGNYKIDGKNKIISTVIDSVEYQNKIIILSKKKLSIKRERTIINYRRL